jgi:hypothetical protein
VPGSCMGNRVPRSAVATSWREAGHTSSTSYLADASHCGGVSQKDDFDLRTGANAMAATLGHSQNDSVWEAQLNERVPLRGYVLPNGLRERILLQDNDSVYTAIGSAFSATHAELGRKADNTMHKYAFFAGDRADMGSLAKPVHTPTWGHLWRVEFVNARKVPPPNPPPPPPYRPRTAWKGLCTYT